MLPEDGACIYQRSLNVRQHGFAVESGPSGPDAFSAIFMLAVKSRSRLPFIWSSFGEWHALASVVTARYRTIDEGSSQWRVLARTRCQAIRHCPMERSLALV
jgi:hypothetical protein